MRPLNRLLRAVHSKSASPDGVLIRKRSRGLGLLETIAALTIMSASAAVIFPWVSQSLRALERTKAAEQRAIATLGSVRWLDALDAHSQPSGTQEFVGFRVRWELKPVNEKPTRVTNSGGQFRAFTSTLYAGPVYIERLNGEPWFTYQHVVVAFVRNTQSTVLPF